MIRALALPLLLILLAAPALAQQPIGPDGRLRVALLKQPVSGERNAPLLSDNPDYLERGGLAERLQKEGFAVRPARTAELTPEERRQYGEWHRLGLANAHLAELVAEDVRAGNLPVGLLANCSSLLGMLAGLQRPYPDGAARRVGLVFIDAHGDFNTPETTLSGMLGGMPVAVSAGLALHRLRQKSGLVDPLFSEDVVIAGLRDADPLEQELIDSAGVTVLSVDDLRARSPRMHEVMRRLSRQTDVIYIHVDMDVLDPAEVPGHGLRVPGGPTSRELADALTEMFRYPKAAAFGVASTPANERDPDGVSRRAAYTLIEGALLGARRR